MPSSEATLVAAAAMVRQAEKSSFHTATIKVPENKHLGRQPKGLDLSQSLLYTLHCVYLSLFDNRVICWSKCSDALQRYSVAFSLLLPNFLPSNGLDPRIGIVIGPKGSKIKLIQDWRQRSFEVPSIWAQFMTQPPQ